jgi:hypothetical protein
MVVRLGALLSLTALSLAWAAAIGPSTAASAVAPVRFEEFVDDTSLAPATSAACGFDVFIHAEGIATVVLFLDAQGNIVKELDGFKQFTLTYFSPDTGKSLSIPQPIKLHTFYSGNEVGDEATAFLAGMDRHAHGATTAGRTEFPAVFAGFGPNGIPDIDQVGPPTVHGVSHTNAELRERLCAALAS